jgi:hypothetical protein
MEENALSDVDYATIAQQQRNNSTLMEWMFGVSLGTSCWL